MARDDNVNSIKQMIPRWDRTHAHVRRERIERAAWGEDSSAYTAIGSGTPHVWVTGRWYEVSAYDGGGDAA